MIRATRKGIVALLFAATVPFASLLSLSVHAAEHPAQEIVVGSTTEMLSILKNEGDRIAAEPEYLSAKVEEIIVPNLDFDTMTKLAVGKFWRQADATQKTELVTEFKTLLLNTYTSAMTEYSGGTISFEPFRAEKRDDRAVVRSVFDQDGGADVPVTYKLVDKSGWSIYDIEVDGLSLVTSYRTAFASEIRKGGIDGLLGTLKKRNARS